MTMNRHQAVVIGAGIAGLSAAVALSSFFAQVYVLDRDELQTSASPRKGVPHGVHPHVLMSGGLEALSRLLPGLCGDLRAAGAIPFELGSELCWEVPGLGTIPKRLLGINSFSLTRPLLELVLVKRVLGLPNITPITRVRSVEVVASADGKRITRVDFQTNQGAPTSVPTDLAIDATGRTAVIKSYFEQQGKPLRPSSQIDVDVHYSTGTFTLPRKPDFTVLVTSSSAPESSRSGFLLRIDERRWHALLIGRGDQRPPLALDAFKAFARELATATMADALDGATLVDGIRGYAFRESLRYGFGSPGPAALPVGLLPIGDSLCRLNPAYGQGISVAGIEAVLLKAALEETSADADPVASACRRYLEDVQSLIAVPWKDSMLSDLVYPQTVGERPGNLMELWSQRRAAVAAAFRDPGAHRDLFRRQQLLFPRGHPGWGANSP